jgi:hypothetical protein
LKLGQLNSAANIYSKEALTQVITVTVNFLNMQIGSEIMLQKPLRPKHMVKRHLHKQLQLLVI